MESIAAIVGGIWIVILAVCTHRAYVWVRCRFSPRYAAQRQLRVSTKKSRQLETYRQRKKSEENRIKVWAEENPTNPAAKALLAEKASPSAPSSSNNESTEEDLQSVLRTRQEAADEFERRVAARQAEEALLVQRLFEWAKANPSTPEGYRFLLETLMEADKKATDAMLRIGYVSHFDHGDDSPEAIAAATRLAEATAYKVAAQQTVSEIQEILTSLTDSQQ